MSPHEPPGLPDPHPKYAPSLPYLPESSIVLFDPEGRQRLRTPKHLIQQGSSPRLVPNTSTGPEHGLPGETPWIIAVPIATEDGVFVGIGAGLYRLVGDRWTRVLPLEDPAVPAEPPALLAGVGEVKASGGFLWAWGQDEIWRYADGAWDQVG